MRPGEEKATARARGGHGRARQGADFAMPIIAVVGERVQRCGHG